MKTTKSTVGYAAGDNLGSILDQLKSEKNTGVKR